MSEISRAKLFQAIHRHNEEEKRRRFWWRVTVAFLFASVFIVGFAVRGLVS
jgi:hypothetical protein